MTNVGMGRHNANVLPPTSSRDQTIGRIHRAFDASFERYCGASTFDQQEDEASNMLHHLYRLSDYLQLWSRNAQVVPEKLESAWALTWVRNADTHRAVRVSEPGDLVTHYLTNLIGSLVWQPVESIPDSAPARARKFEQTLAGHPVGDSLRFSFDALLDASSTTNKTGGTHG